MAGRHSGSKPNLYPNHGDVAMDASFMLDDVETNGKTELIDRGGRGLEYRISQLRTISA
jgi:hypothetical protein